MIESLTPEQTALFPHYVKKWLDIGLNTQRADRKAAEEGVRMAYAAADLPPPKEIRWTDSPHAGGLLAAKFAENNTLTPLYGQHDAAWLSFYDYMEEVLGLEVVKPLHGLMQIAKASGWWWAFDELAIMSERACELHRDPQNRLHNETGMAIKYPDGWGMYVWHGVTVPEAVILDPKSLSPADIKAEPNIEVRRIMIERYGVGDYLHEIKAEIVHMDITTPLGGAPRMLLREPPQVAEPSPEASENESPRAVPAGLQYLCATDGSTKRVYFMSVPPTVKTCREAHEAICGINEDSIVAEC